MGMRSESILGADIYGTSTFGDGGVLNLLTAWNLPK